MDLHEMTQGILQKIPQKVIPTPEDGQLLSQYKMLFEMFEDEIVAGFYDVIYNDEDVSHYLNRSERTLREQSLRQWYQVSTSGCFDGNYWHWQALVGMVHVKHGIPNPTMLGMWSWMIDAIQNKLLECLSLDEALPVIEVLHKLQGTVGGLIAESFIMTQQEAIAQVSGLNTKILSRFIDIEIDKILADSRAILHQATPSLQIAV